MDAARHQCMIYEGSPAKHLPGLASLLVEKLRSGMRCLYLNSPAMVAGIRSYLAATGLDVAAEIASGALVLSSDSGHLVGGRFDPDRMIALLKDAADTAVNEGYAGLWASGDMTWEFGPEKNFTKLREYEQGLEELFGKCPHLQGICQYHADTLPVEGVEEALYSHRACYVNETLSRMNPCFSGGSEARIPVSHSQRLQMVAAPA